MPRASEIVDPHRFRVVQSDGPARNVIIEGTIGTQQFHANRAVRFGQVVQLPQDEGIPIDFWNTPR